MTLSSAGTGACLPSRDNDSEQISGRQPGKNLRSSWDYPETLKQERAYVDPRSGKRDRSVDLEGS